MLPILSARLRGYILSALFNPESVALEAGKLFLKRMDA